MIDLANNNLSPVQIRVCALPHATCVTFSGFKPD